VLRRPVEPAANNGSRAHSISLFVIICVAPDQTTIKPPLGIR
jgi:hypothetical protein